MSRDPNNLRSWPYTDLLYAVRAAGITWQDGHSDNLTEKQCRLLDRAATSYLADDPGTPPVRAAQALTLQDAGAPAAILDAAERGAVVADAIPNYPATLTWGRARRIGNDDMIAAARIDADVRDLFLYVHVAEVGEVGWSVRDLISRYLSGWFIVDFDLGTYREAVANEPGRRAEGWSVPDPEPRMDDMIPLPGEDGENTVNSDDDIADSDAASLLPTAGPMNPVRPEGSWLYDEGLVAYVVRETTSDAMRVLTSSGHLGLEWGLGTEHDIRHDQTWCPLGRWAVVGYRNFQDGLVQGEVPDRPLRHWVFK